MFSRRRASPEELAQGEREMLAAQKRLEEETEKKDGKPIEDVKVPEGTDSFEAPKASQRVKDAEGSEEKHASSPKSFAPPLPVQDAPQVKPAETKVTPGASPAQVKSEPKMPAPALGTPSESHGAVAPAVMDVNAPKVEKNVQVVPMVEQNVQGVSNGHQHPGDPSSTTPAPTSAGISPNAPLFDEQQAWRFHELFSQAPWLYIPRRTADDAPAADATSISTSSVSVA